MEIRASDLKPRQKGKRGTQVPSQFRVTLAFLLHPKSVEKKKHREENSKGQMGPWTSPALSRVSLSLCSLPGSVISLGRGRCRRVGAGVCV